MAMMLVLIYAYVCANVMMSLLLCTRITMITQISHKVNNIKLLDSFVSLSRASFMCDDVRCVFCVFWCFLATAMNLWLEAAICTCTSLRLWLSIAAVCTLRCLKFGNTTKVDKHETCLIIKYAISAAMHNGIESLP